jgi:hypothetical protein
MLPLSSQVATAVLAAFDDLPSGTDISDEEGPIKKKVC